MLQSLVLTLITATTAIKTACPIIQDGRVPKSMPLEKLDTSDSPFNTQFVKGANLSFSAISRFPPCTDNSNNNNTICNISRFSSADTKPIEITISDASIFVPAVGAKPQLGFRRAEYLLKNNDGGANDASVQGKRVYHWSVMQDPLRPLNLSHDYLSVFHELGDASGRQWEVRVGTPIGEVLGDESRGWRFAGKDGRSVWWTALVVGKFQNFAVVMDYEAGMVQLWYSRGMEVLVPVMDVMANDNAGAGQWHVGIVKHPTETETVVYEGYQESGIDERLVYSDIFVEDGANGCISS